MDAEIASRKLSRRAQRKRHAARQKAWRAKRKQRFQEAVAMLDKIADDDRIVVTGKEYQEEE